MPKKKLNFGEFLYCGFHQVVQAILIPRAFTLKLLSPGGPLPLVAGRWLCPQQNNHPPQMCRRMDPCFLPKFD